MKETFRINEIWPVIKPPIVKAEIIWNSLGTIWLRYWKYDDKSPTELEVQNLDEVYKIIGETIPPLAAVQEMHDEWNRD